MTGNLVASNHGIWLMVVCVSFGAADIVSSSTGDNNDRVRAANNDSTNVLFLLAKEQGIDVGYHDIASFFREKDRITLRDVRDCGARVGLDLSMVKMTPEQLRALRRPAIAVLESQKDKGRFILLPGLEHNDLIWYISGDDATVNAIPIDDFRRSWTGIVLIPARNEDSGLKTVIAFSAVTIGICLVAGTFFRRRSRPAT